MVSPQDMFADFDNGPESDLDDNDPVLTEPDSDSSYSEDLDDDGGGEEQEVPGQHGGGRRNGCSSGRGRGRGGGRSGYAGVGRGRGGGHSRRGGSRGGSRGGGRVERGRGLDQDGAHSGNQGGALGDDRGGRFWGHFGGRGRENPCRRSRLGLADRANEDQQIEEEEVAADDILVGAGVTEARQYIRRSAWRRNRIVKSLDTALDLDNYDPVQSSNADVNTRYLPLLYANKSD